MDNIRRDQPYKPLNHQQLKLPGPPLRRLFCALIAQNQQHSSGRLAERYWAKGMDLLI